MARVGQMGGAVQERVLLEVERGAHVELVVGGGRQPHAVGQADRDVDPDPGRVTARPILRPPARTP